MDTHEFWFMCDPPLWNDFMFILTWREIRKIIYLFQEAFSCTKYIFWYGMKSAISFDSCHFLWNELSGIRNKKNGACSDEDSRGCTCTMKCFTKKLQIKTYWELVVTYLDFIVLYIIHIYIKSSEDRSVSFYQNSSVWLPVAGIETRLSQTPIQTSTPQPRGNSCSEINFKRLWITITIVYIHPLNGYRDLNSYMKRLAINANGNTITSFA